MILAFAGRRPGSDAFPEEAVAGVSEQVAQRILELAPRLAVGSAAAGADILVAEAVLRSGGRVELLLAGDRAHFRADSVEDKGRLWADRFDALLAQGAVTVREVPLRGDADASYRAVTAAIAERAEQLSQEGEQTAMLAVSSPRDGGTDHTEELVRLAQARGWSLLRIETAGG